MINLFVLYGLAFVILVNVVLYFFILSKRGKKTTDKIFSFMSILMIIWSIALLGFYFLGDYLFSSRIWIVATHILALLISVTFLFFTLNFPNKLNRNKSLRYVILSIPVIMSYFIIFTNFIIGDVNGLEYEINKGYIIYSLTVSLYFLLGYIALLIQARKTKNKIEKIQVKYIFIGSILSSFFATITDLILPYFGNFSLTWLGPFFTLLLVMTLAIAIWKHHLFNIKVIASEGFVFLLLATLFANIILSANSLMVWVNVFIFISAAFFGFLLVKSILKELEINKKLKRANEELKRMDRAKSEFISMASHQLRTPLTSIKGYISMIIDGDYGKISKEPKDTLKKVFKSNERLIGLVNDLLNISRIELGKIEVHKQEEDIIEIVESCYDEIVKKAEKKGLKFVFRKPRKKLPNIYVDGMKIKEVVLNLMDNAIRYTAEGEVKTTILSENGDILVTIKDTGSGMTKEEIISVFEGFSRGSSGLNMFIEGTGLGLYIAKKFLALHKGEVWAESDGKGKGSTFFVKIPVKV